MTPTRSLGAAAVAVLMIVVAGGDASAQGALEPAAARAPVAGGVLGGPAPSVTRADHRACDRGDGGACWRIAGSMQGKAGAYRYEERACAKSVAFACVRAADSFARAHPGKRGVAGAMRIYGRGCDAGDSESCLVLASIHGKAGTAAGRRRQRALMKRSCRLGYRRGCEKYGISPPIE